MVSASADLDLPYHRMLLPFNRGHPLLAVWKVSGMPMLTQGFRTVLQRLSQLGGGREPTRLINQDGSNGAAGVVSVPFYVMSSTWTS